MRLIAKMNKKASQTSEKRDSTKRPKRTTLQIVQIHHRLFLLDIK